MPIFIADSNGDPQAIKGVFQMTAGGVLAPVPAYVQRPAGIELVTAITKQYPVLQSRTYDGGYYYNDDGKSYYDLWWSDNILRQGSYASSYYDSRSGSNYDAQRGPFYGTMLFGTGSGTPGELVGRTVLSARIFLHRYSDGEGTRQLQIMKTNLTTVPGSGAHSPNGNYIAPAIVSNLGEGASAWFAISTDIAQAAINGNCLVLYQGSSYYCKYYGIESPANKPILEITYS